MDQFHISNKYFSKSPLVFAALILCLTNLVGCRLLKFEYPANEQHGMAVSRVESMKHQLDFSFRLEKESISFGEPILFTAQFTNETDSPLTLRVPQQSGVQDIDFPNTTLEYSIDPVNESVSLCTPISCMGMPLILVNEVYSSEFETLKPYSTSNVTLELPNIVYIQDGEISMESPLPIGQYVINVSYINLYIGYGFNKGEETWFVDLHAWVGRIEAEQVILTVLP